MKEVKVHSMEIGGERSEGSLAEVPQFRASGTSFFFHPLSQYKVFTLLLSTFTHTRANARACARTRVCARGVVKEERS